MRGSRWDIACSGPDCTDEVTFLLSSTSPGLVLLSEHPTMPADRRELSFGAGALDDANEILTIEQGNYVASEIVRAPATPLAACTPPFLLSRSLAARAHAREDIALELVAYLGRPLSLRFERESRVTVRLDAEERSVRALRFLGYEDDGVPDESIGLLELEVDSPILLSVRRDDGMFGTTLRAVRSCGSANGRDDLGAPSGSTRRTVGG